MGTHFCQFLFLIDRHSQSNLGFYPLHALLYQERFVIVFMSGAICGFAQSADRAARFADPHIAQLICRSRSYRKIAQA